MADNSYKTASHISFSPSRTRARFHISPWAAGGVRRRRLLRRAAVSCFSRSRALFLPTPTSSSNFPLWSRVVNLIGVVTTRPSLDRGRYQIGVKHILFQKIFLSLRASHTSDFPPPIFFSSTSSSSSSPTSFASHACLSLFLFPPFLPHHRISFRIRLRAREATDERERGD